MLRGCWFGAFFVVVACAGNNTSSPSQPAGGASANAGAASVGNAAGAPGAANGGAANAGAPNGGTAHAGATAGGGANGGTANAGATAGGAANGGTVDGGAAGMTGCAPGAVRCNTVREHCDGSGTWVAESFVCAVDITGAEEEQMACAVKSDGRMACFGNNIDFYLAPLLAGAPTAIWRKLFLSDDPIDMNDHALCGIDDSGEGHCWTSSTSQARPFASSVRQIGNGSYGLCVVNEDGSGGCPEDLGLSSSAVVNAGPFLQYVIRNNALFALRADGTVILPYPEWTLPAGPYIQLSASNAEVCAVHADGALSCTPSALPAAFASLHFLQVAVDYYGSMCAIRDDHSVVCDPLAGHGITAPADQYTQLAAVSGGMCGIRSDGSVACFGASPPASMVPPDDW